MKRFVYFYHLHGSYKDVPITFILNRNDTILEQSEETFEKYEDLRYMNIHGFIYAGEKDVSDHKEVAVCVYKKQGKLRCQIIKFNNRSERIYHIQVLYDFELNANYEIKNIYLFVCDYFYIKNKITGKKEFEVYYYHPYNRTIFYDGMFEDIQFKELSKDYKDEKWLEQIYNMLTEDNA